MTRSALVWPTTINKSSVAVKQAKTQAHPVFSGQGELENHSLFATFLSLIVRFSRMDLHENTDNNTVTATFELPGLKKDDVSIDVHNGRLTISGESKMSTEHDEGGYAIRERRYGRFSRTLQLPQGVKVNQPSFKPFETDFDGFVYRRMISRPNLTMACFLSPSRRPVLKRHPRR